MKAKRTLVFGDIHGAYKALEQVLKRAKVSKEDKLIFLGDYVDGWSGSKKVISKLIELQKVNECIFIRGNHDALFQEWLDTKEINQRWLVNGGNSTITAYKDVSDQTLEEHHKFLKSLQNYYVNAQNQLFVHGGFTNLRGPENEYYDYIFYWDRTLWETAIATDPRLNPENLRYPKRFTLFREIFIGHTPTVRIGETKPTQALNVWNVDSGAAFKGRLSVLEVETKEVFQSEPVFKLYPKEKGRN